MGREERKREGKKEGRKGKIGRTLLNWRLLARKQAFPEGLIMLY